MIIDDVCVVRFEDSNGDEDDDTVLGYGTV